MAMHSAVQGPMPEMAVRRALLALGSAVASRVVREMELEAGTTGVPTTYLHEGKQYVLVPIGGREVPGQWIALSLP